ncbi:MAG: polysaccharide deacetylase family protein [Candidatus Omnitrophota bacterium]
MLKRLSDKYSGALKVIIILVLVLAVVFSISKFLKSAYVVPVLMYHKIDNNFMNSKLSVSPKSFEKQMRFLRKKNYNIVSLDKLKMLLSSKLPIPRKTIAVTFDDGYKNNYTAAFPTLKKYSIPATVFVVTDKVGRDGYMSWDDLKEMSENNIHIGSHTVSECFLPDIKDKEQLRKEIFDSRKIIRKKLPGQAEFFGYCSGGFNEEIRNLVIEAGYKGACATNPGKDYPKHDIYAMKRQRISRTSDNLVVFWIESSGFYTWIKEHRDDD